MKTQRLQNYLRTGLVLSGVGLLSVLSLGPVSAAALTSASLTLGDSRPSVVTSYTSQASGFTTATSLGCIQFQFAVNPDMTGGVPTGLTSTGATLTSSTLITASGATVAATTNGTVNLTFTTAQAPATSGNVVLGNITNGSTAGTAYYEKITTFTSTSCTGAVDNVTVGLIYTAGQAVSVTVNPILSFSVGGLASGTAVNGSTSNFATTSGTIPFGTTPTVSTNGVGAQSLTVSTNSGNGYTVATSYTGPLTNGTHNITNFSGTNAAPTAFTAAGSENFGYTTAGLARFSPNLWAGLTTSAAVVASSTAAVNNQTTDTAFQIGLASTTSPGSYSSTVIYTATPLY